MMKPKEIKFPEGFVVRHIYAGYYQAAAISTNNTLLVWGKVLINQASVFTILRTRVLV